MRLIIGFSLFSFLFAGQLSAQELNCKVQILNPQIQLTNKDILINLQGSIIDFLNTKRWTNETYTPAEKIECNILITLTVADQNSGQLSGSIQVSASRPVYGTSYISNSFLILDKNFNINYQASQQLIYTEGVYNNELTTLLAFYAYTIIGYDADTYTEYGGTPYFQKAMNIVNSAQSSGADGWNALEKNERNRYHIAFDLNNEQYRPIRKALYIYYRKGLDLMAEDNVKGLQAVVESVQLLKDSRRQFPNVAINKIFFESKWLEIIDLFTQADPEIRCKARTLLMETDIVNANRYGDRIPAC